MSRDLAGSKFWWTYPYVHDRGTSHAAEKGVYAMHACSFDSLTATRVHACSFDSLTATRDEKGVPAFCAAALLS